MKKISQVNDYLNKFDDKLMQLLKESNTDTLKRTVPKDKNTSRTEDPKLYTPKSLESFDRSRYEMPKQPYLYEPPINILDRLKIIEQQYCQKISILEEDNSNLRKQISQLKANYQNFEQKQTNFDDEKQKLHQHYQELLAKQLLEQQQQNQNELKKQELNLKKQYEKTLQRKEQRIKDLETMIVRRKDEPPLFTFKTQD